MTDLQDIHTRLARLESRVAISELVTRYALACDEHDLPALAELFTPDAVFETPNGMMQATGRDAIVAMFDQVLSVRGPGYHWTHDHVIRFDRGSESAASGLILSHAETIPNGVQSLAAMSYRDEYRDDGAGWRFARRELRFLYYVPVADYGTALGRADRVAAGAGRMLPADYPEPLEVWQAFAARHTAR